MADLGTRRGEQSERHRLAGEASVADVQVDRSL